MAGARYVNRRLSPLYGTIALDALASDLAEDNGTTTLTCLMDFGTKEARDAAMSTGMTDGMEVNY